ncbi:MAG TPA: TonB-dependent receptor [Opitutaceae bacterium]|nr:TonB-dependent receptor [Opitutaceae bacterium]
MKACTLFASPRARDFAFLSRIGKPNSTRIWQHVSTVVFTHCAVLIALFLSFGALAVSGAQETSVIEGRVSNVVSGIGLANAQVRILPSGQITQTDTIGEFRFTGLSAGEVQLSVSFYGMQTHNQTLTLGAGDRLQLSIELRRVGVASDDGSDRVVKLEAFDVTADREMTAQSIALNEQRAAPNIKNVVALDQFGNQNDENLGEFMHFLPGVGVTVAGDDGPTGVSLRGFPSNYSNISVDGGSVATGRGNSRSISLTDVPFLNASRVEITKVPTPDMPAAGLGGSINIIPKNGFELKERALSYRITGLTQSTNGARVRWPKGQTEDISPRYTVPSMSLTYQGTLHERVAVTAAVSNTWRFKPAEDGEHSLDLQPTWNRVTNVQTSGAWQALPSLYRTYGGQLGFDFKLSPKDVLTVGGQIKFHTFDLARSRLLVNYGTGATGAATFTQGASTGVGNVNTSASWYSRYNKQRQLNLKYSHRGDVWSFDVNADYSDARYYEDSSANGYFDTVDAQISNLVIRGDNILPRGIATSYVVRDRAGNPVDIYNGGNYIINAVTDRHRISDATLPAIRASLSRDFDGAVPVTLKAGIAADQQERDFRLYTDRYTFQPNGATDEASRRAGLFPVFDEEFLKDSAANIFGTPLREISNKKVYELYQKNPSWFVWDEAAAHQSLATNSNKLTISAAYIRGDFKFLSNRLGVTTGVRFERTAVEGAGPLNDIAAQYRRNPDGSIARNANGTPILITTDTLALRKLRYVERGASSSSEYQGFYPSVNSSYRFNDHLVFRLAYARTIGRPNVNFIIPGTTITEPDAANPTITVNNPGLLPWTADNYDLSVEVYEVKGGSGSISIFQKNVTDFFGTINTPVTDALLTEQGLPTDGTYDGYQFSTRNNVGDAKITGYEMSYRQSLTFLPGILKSFQLYANLTKLSTQGERSADFSGFVPSNLSAGINFIRPRYFLKLNYIHQDSFRTTSVAQSATEPADTYNYQPVYRRWGLNGEYSFSKRYSVFASAADLGRREAGDMRFAPSTPDYARYTRYQLLGYYIMFGVKGTF